MIASDSHRVISGSSGTQSPKSFRSHLESPLRVLLVVAKIVTITLRRPRPFSFQKFSVPVSLTRCRFTLVGTNAGARARVSLVHPLKKCKHSCPPISVRRIRRFALRPTGHFPRPKVFRPIRGHHTVSRAFSGLQVCICRIFAPRSGVKPRSGRMEQH